MNDLLNKKFICKSNMKRYEVINVIKYKDENSGGKTIKTFILNLLNYQFSFTIKHKDEVGNKWIYAVIYKPLYDCDIKEFSRSESMFRDSFFLDPDQKS